MMNPLLVSLALMLAPPAATADPGARMAPLADLVGEWRGSGWMIGPDGKRSEFTSREVVTRRLGGAALLVEGQHRAGGRIVHDAMAMLTWDARANAYRFRTALSSGMGGDFPMTVAPGRFQWTIGSPGGKIDYVATFGNGTWRETGTRTGSDGKAAPFFEMTLKRQ